MRKLLILVVLSILFVCAACTKKTLPADYDLHTVEDESALKELLQGSNNESAYGDDKIATPPLQEDTVNGNEGAPSANTTPGHSETNVQVDGVDEGDIIKTDGKRIYVASYRYFIVFEVADGDIQEIYREDFNLDKTERYVYAYELYVTDRYAIVIGSSYSLHTMNFWRGPSQSQVVINIYDIASEEVSLVKEMTISGYYNTSRLMEDKLYVVSNYTVYLQNDPVYRPTFSVDGIVTIPEYNEIQYIGGLVNNTYTIFTTINLQEEITVINDSFIGYTWGIFYVSQDSFYLASYKGTQDANGYYATTDVIRYKINRETDHVEFKGYINILGSILNQFSMDEYDGYFRIVTTVDRWINETKPVPTDDVNTEFPVVIGRNTTNHLYVFRVDETNEKGFVEVGHLSEGLGKPGETVKSVRFNQNEVSVVTYVQTDPLYIIDLSDPAHPVIKGQLETPGFSTYQQVWDEFTILGIGYDAVGNRINGLKISLYDRTDAANPMEIANIKIQGYSEAIYNHKAILVDKANNIFGISVYRYVYDNTVSYGYSIEEYYLIKVDRTSDTPLKIVGVITHANDDVDSYNYYYCAFLGINRVVMINNYYYAISSGKISSHIFENNELKLIKEVKIQNYEYAQYWICID